MKEFILGRYTFGKTIGEGAFSKVKMATVLETGEKVAIKVIDKKMMAEIEERSKKAQDDRERKRIVSERKKAQKELMRQRKMEESDGSDIQNPDLGQILQDLQKQNQELENVILPERSPIMSKFLPNLQKEVKLLIRLDHPNIIKVFEIYDSPDTCYIIMELAKGGELMDYITTRKKLAEKESRKYFRQIVSGLAHIHAANVVHRDLKLENILLSKDMNCLITDFGLGNSFDSDSTIMKTFCGTPNYASAELVAGLPYDGVKSDIWSLGIILYILCAGKRPFVGSTLAVLYQKILNLDYSIPNYFSPELTDLLGKILVKDPKNRITIEEICKHAWTNIGFDAPPNLIPPRASADEAKIAQKIRSIHNESVFTVYSINPINPKAAAITAERVEKVRIASARKRAESVAPAHTPLGSLFNSSNSVGQKVRKSSDTGLLMSARKSDASMSNSGHSRNSSFSFANPLRANSSERSNELASPLSPNGTSWSRISSKHSLEFPQTTRKRSGSFTQPIIFFNQVISVGNSESSDFSIKEEPSSENALKSTSIEEPTNLPSINYKEYKIADSNTDTLTPKGSVVHGHTGSRTSALSVDTNTSTIRAAAWSSTDRKYSPRTRASFQAEFSIPETGEESETAMRVKPISEVTHSSVSDTSSNNSVDFHAAESQSSRPSASKRDSFDTKAVRVRAASTSKRDSYKVSLSSKSSKSGDNIDLSKSKVSKVGRRKSSKKPSKTQGESSLRNSVVQVERESSTKSESNAKEIVIPQSQLSSKSPISSRESEIDGSHTSEARSKTHKKYSSLSSSGPNSTPSSQDLGSFNNSGVDSIPASSKSSLKGKSRPRTLSAVAIEISSRKSTSKPKSMTKSSSFGDKISNLQDLNNENGDKLVASVIAVPNLKFFEIDVEPTNTVNSSQDLALSSMKLPPTDSKHNVSKSLSLKIMPPSNSPPTTTNGKSKLVENVFETELNNTEVGLRKRATTNVMNNNNEVQTAELPRTGQSLSSASRTSSFHIDISKRKSSDVKSEQTYPTDAEIQSWHDTHKPATVIRTVRFPFHKGLASFELEPARIFVDLHDCLCALAELGNLNGLFNFEFRRPVVDYYLFDIKVDFYGARQTLKFDAEVCKLWMLKMYGVRLKRIQGDSFDFKTFHGLIVDGLGYK